MQGQASMRARKRMGCPLDRGVGVYEEVKFMENEHTGFIAEPNEWQ